MLVDKVQGTQFLSLDTAENLVGESFLKTNEGFILSSTPKNPSISRDDEWIEDSQWDEFNQKEQ